MHEFTIAQAIAQQLAEVIAQQRLERVVAVRLQIGVLCGIVPECLDVCLQALFEHDRVLENAQVEIELVPVKITCDQCGVTSELEELLFFCPVCGSKHVELINGKELMLNSIEVEQADEA